MSATLVTPPVTWHGGKARMAPLIIAQFPPHRTYVELFGGSGAVLLAKERSLVEVYNEIDGDLVNLFLVLRHRTAFDYLSLNLGLTLYSRAEFDLAAESATDPVEAARRFIVRQLQSHGGHGDHWSFSRVDSRAGVASTAARWLRGLEALPDVHERLQGVQVERGDWRAAVERYDAGDTLFYADPPYVPETRIRGGYEHELSEDAHGELAEVLQRVKGMVVLSGYSHAVYAPLEAAGWSRLDCEVLAHSSTTRTRRVECLWINPAAMAAKGREQLQLFERHA